MKEEISALLDAELKGRKRDRVLEELGSNAELRKAWERYHLISAALRNELEVVVAPRLADRIADSIKRDSSLGASPSRFVHKWQSNIKRNFAIAASIVTLVLALPFIIPYAPTNIAKQTIPTLTADAAFEGNIGRANAGWEQRSQWEKALDTFLVEHNEHTPISVMNGMMSYVRLASYDNDSNNEK